MRSRGAAGGGAAPRRRRPAPPLRAAPRRARGLPPAVRPTVLGWSGTSLAIPWKPRRWPLEAGRPSCAPRERPQRPARARRAAGRARASRHHTDHPTHPPAPSPTCRARLPARGRTNQVHSKALELHPVSLRSTYRTLATPSGALRPPRPAAVSLRTFHARRKLPARAIHSLVSPLDSMDIHRLPSAPSRATSARRPPTGSSADLRNHHHARS